MKRPHDGGKCPVPGDTLVKVWYDALNAEAWLCGFAREWHWSTVVQYEVLIPADEAQAEIDAAKTERDSAIARAEFLSAELKALREQMPQRSRRDQFICSAMGVVWTSASRGSPIVEIAGSTVCFADAVMAEADRGRT